MTYKLFSTVCCLMLLLASCGRSSTSNNTPTPQPIDSTNVVHVYVTSADQTNLFAERTISIKTDTPPPNSAVITLNPSVQYQTMDGFGAAITGSSAYNLLKMNAEDRKALLVKTFDPEQGMGFSEVRISIGCSDFSLSNYTYCDQKGIENFAIHATDQHDLIPILKEILAINPQVKILASPWTCPLWMKVNNLKDLKPLNTWYDGQLNPKYYQDYATYFVKYIQAMQAYGITIDAITIQNEPLNRGNSASLFMTWQEQAAFIKTALGPAFKKASIQTKIIAFDHNFNYDNDKAECKDQYGYPLNIYKDADAAQYVDGAAYHAYGGEVSEMLRVHNAAPNKNLYFTEMSIGMWDGGYTFSHDLMWNTKEVCLGSINNYSKAVIMWNYLLDDKHGPYVNGGCDVCIGAIDINSSNYKTLTYNSHFYEMAHLSKVVRPNAHRIQSSLSGISEGITCSAFTNVDGSTAVVLLNEANAARSLVLKNGTSVIVYTAPAQSVVSFRWK